MNTALTELAGVADCPTESAYAWALDYDEYEPTTPLTLTPRRVIDGALAGSLVLIGVAGVVAVLVIRGVWSVDEPVIVAAPSPTPAVTTTVVTAPTTVTVQASPTVTVPAPPPAQTIEAKPTRTIPPPDEVAFYDQQFINQMTAQGWTDINPTQFTHKAHEVCGEFQRGYSPAYVNQKLVDENNGELSMHGAQVFTSTAMLTYPNCP
jgi:hypothetical protein